MTATSRIQIIVPVFNDWVASARLMRELDEELMRAGRTADVLLVDDASWEEGSAPSARADAHPHGIGAVRILRLRRNLGHQRAIAIALAFIEAVDAPDFVVIMDGDGEDRPSDVPRLLAAAERERIIVFAERRRRSEGALFAALYHGYRVLHFILTGISVRVGNFSVVPRAQLSRLVAVSDLWNHFAAAVFKSRIPFTTIVTERGTRYAGRSQMNYALLAAHGLSAMAAFGDRIGVRLLAAAATLGLIVAVALGLTVARVMARYPEMSVWIPLAIALVLLTLFQAFAVSLTFVFVILGRRDSATFLPLRDYRDFVLNHSELERPGP